MNTGRFKRLICALLAACTLACTAVGCAEKVDEGTEETEASNVETVEETEEETDRAHTKDNLPDNLDFGGETVTIHGRGDSGSIRELSCDLTGDVVEDAIYTRNLNVENRLNIHIEPFTPYGWQNYSQALAQIRSSIASGDNEFTLIAGYSAPAPALASEGLVLNLNSLPYLDTSMPWWAQSIVNDLDINGNLAFIAGDISLTMIASSYSMAVNFSIAESYNISGFYDIVNNGQWTIDKVNEIATTVYDDVNGNGKKDIADTLGLIFCMDYANDADSFMQGAMVTLTSRDEEGYPYLDVNLERMNDLVSKVYTLFYECDGSLLDKNANPELEFPKGNALLCPSYLEFFTNAYKGMEDDYGILPYPKYDEVQEKYSTRVQDGVSIWCVPTTANNLDLCGASLEALCAESYRLVTPAYFDTALKVKYSRDDESSHMLDIIREGVMFNFEIIYNNEMGGAWNIMRDMMSNKKNNFASEWARKEKSYTRALEKLVEKLADKLEEK